MGLRLRVLSGGYLGVSGELQLLSAWAPLGRPAKGAVTGSQDAGGARRCWKEVDAADSRGCLCPEGTAVVSEVIWIR